MEVEKLQNAKSIPYFKIKNLHFQKPYSSLLFSFHFPCLYLRVQPQFFDLP